MMGAREAGGVSSLRTRRVAVAAAAALLLSSIVQAAPAPLSVYGSLPGIETADLSPSGERMAIVGQVKGARRLIVVDAQGNLLKTAELGDIKVRSLDWAGEDDVLLVRSDTFAMDPNIRVDMAELLTGLVVPLDDRPVWKLLDGTQHLTGTFNRWRGMRQRDGRIYGYFGAMTKEVGIGNQVYLATGRPDLYEVDMKTGKSRKIAEHSVDGWRDWLIGPDGGVAASIDFNGLRSIWSIANGRGNMIASGKNKLGDVDLVSLGPTPGTLIYSIGNPEDSSLQWFQAALVGGGGLPYLAEADAQSPIVEPKDGRLLGYYRGGIHGSHHFLDAARQKALDAAIKAFGGQTVTLKDWNEDFSKLLVLVEGGSQPQSWFTVDLKSRRANPVGTAYPLAADQIGPVRMVRYKANDGLEIEAVLTLPPGAAEKGLPVVILPHGGPNAHDSIGFDWLAQAFASRGYAVLQPNFRGSTGYGPEFMRAGYGQWGRAMQSDVSDGLKYLIDQGIVDPKRACILGASYGGYVALAGVTMQNGLYRCAVSIAGVSDLAQFASTARNQSGRDPTLMRALDQELGKGRDLKAVSPVNWAAKADAPVLLVHGKDDTVVLLKQSSDMEKALRAAGKPVEMVTLAGEDHWLSRSETRLAMLEAAMAFVQKHNPAETGR